MYTQRLFAMFILAVAIAALSITLLAEYYFGKEPCTLCLYQRVPFLTTGLFAIIILCQKKLSELIPIIFMFCALIYLAGSGLAIYHVGVERLWWSSDCSGSLNHNTTLEELRASLMQKAEIPCDEVNWRIFGVSMATYNAFFSSALCIISIMISFKMSKKLMEKTI